LQTGELGRSDQRKVAQPLGRKLPITLVPLQRDGAESLNVAGIPGLRRITFVEAEVILDNLLHEVAVFRADDLFACESRDALHHHQAALKAGQITRAIFRIVFSDGHCILVEIRTPDTMSCMTGADAELVERWLAQSHFTTPSQRAPPNDH
jgi:hypothetical protein